MQAIEFETKIENGVIKIPENYKINLDKEIKVIILYDEFIDTLKEKNPVKKNKTLFDVIGAIKLKEDISAKQLVKKARERMGIENV